MKQVLLTTATLLTLTSCAMPETHEIINDNKLPERFLTKDEMFAESVKDFWKLPFNDQNIKRILLLAFENNSSIKLAWRNLEKSGAILDIQQAGRKPVLDMNMSNTVSRTKVDGEGDSRSESNDLGLSLSWELDLWGRIQKQVDSEKFEYEATEQDLEFTYLLIASKAIENYLLLSALTQNSQNFSTIVTVKKDKFELIKSLYKSGNADANQLNVANYEYIQAEYELVQLKSDILNKKSQLAVLLGIKQDQLDEFLPISYDKNLELTNIDLINARPDLLAAKNRFLSANSKTQAAKLERFPTLKVDLGYGFSAAKVSDLYSSTLFDSLVQLKLPIFRGGQIKANINLAKSEQEIALINYIDLTNTVLNEVQANYEIYQQQSIALNFAKDKLKLAESNYKIAQKKYNLGNFDYLELLAEKQTYLEAKNTYVNANNVYLNSVLNVYSTVGGINFIDS